MPRAAISASDALRAYAELAARVGINVQPGQHVRIAAGAVEHAPIARAVADAAYRAGAFNVAVAYADRHVTRSLVEHGPDAGLDWTPPGELAAIDHLAETRGALVQVLGDPDPALFEGLDAGRLALSRRRTRWIERLRPALQQHLIAWTIVAQPNEGWARTVFGEPDVERLWDAVAFALRLDEDEPVAAWRDQVARLRARADRLNELALDGLRYRGPGTDLFVGLLDHSRWATAAWETADGVEHVVNLPTEEVYTAPDWRRTSGTVRSTRPLALLGPVIEGIELTFEEGRAVTARARTGEDVLRAQLTTDEQANALGEVALVDGSSRVAQSGLLFFETLFDENAASHLAFGNAPTGTFAGGESREERLAAGVNSSITHVDFMIGGPEIAVHGVTRAGDEVPLLVDDRWQI